MDLTTLVNQSFNSKVKRIANIVTNQPISDYALHIVEIGDRDCQQRLLCIMHPDTRDVVSYLAFDTKKSLDNFLRHKSHTQVVYTIENVEY